MHSDDTDLHDDPALNDIARALLEGVPVDWAAIESGTNAAQIGIVRQLRALAELADVHRTPLPADGPDGGAAPDWWGHLRLLEHIGGGSFGDVYRAWDSRLDREVALKLIRRRGSDAGKASAFVEEGRLLARVRHPNVVTVYGAERIDGHDGIWTEFIHGRTLAGIVREQGPLPVDDALAIGIDVCGALAAVHNAGLLHRDVKAQNVMREDSGRIVLMDLGAGGELLCETGDTPRVMAGTPLYLAPEVLAGAAPTPSSDVYSTGVLLYHLLTGTYPAEGATIGDVHAVHENGGSIPLVRRRPQLSKRLLQVVDGAIATDPAQRLRSASAFADALRQARRGAVERIGLHRPRTAAAVTAAALILGGSAAWHWAGRSPRAIPQVHAQPGPAATLMIGGVKDRVNDAALALELSQALEKSVPVAYDGPVVQRDRIDALLRLARQPSETSIDVTLGRTLAELDRQISLIVSGEVFRRAQHYAVRLSVTDVISGNVVATAEDTQIDRGVLRAGISKAAATLFSDLPAAVRSAPVRLEPVTAGKSETVRLYSESRRAVPDDGRVDWKAAADLVDRALQLEPDFAMGHRWKAEVLRYSGKPRAEWMPHLNRALELAPATQPWEQHSIRALDHLWNGRHGEAIPEYSALLALRPYDRRAVDDLYSACYMTNAPDTATPYRLTAAMLRPGGFRANLAAAEALTSLRGDASAALTYVQRALAASDGKDAYPVAWLRFFEPFERWTAGDIDGALRHVDAVTDTFRRGDALARRRGVRSAALFALSAGQLTRAGQYLAELPDSADREREKLQMLWAFERGAIDETRQRLRELAALKPAGGLSPLAASLMARLGLRGEFEQTLSSMMKDPLSDDEVGGELALRAGRPAEAILRLQRAVDRQRRSGGAMLFPLSDSLARALVLGGRRNDAIEVLEAAGRDKARAYPLAWPGGHLGIGWLRTQGALVQLYHDAGREQDERLLRETLFAHLSAADRDYPLRLQLERSARAHRR